MTAEQIMIEQIMLENQEIGRIKGRKEGREKGIQGMIAFSKKNDVSELDVIEAVVSSMGMSEEEARMIVKKYW